MVSAAFRSFVITALVLVTLAFGIVALVVPPDPFTQLRYAGPLAVLAVLVAYLQAYRGTFDALLARF